MSKWISSGDHLSRCFSTSCGTRTPAGRQYQSVAADYTAVQRAPLNDNFDFLYIFQTVNSGFKYIHEMIISISNIFSKGSVLDLNLFTKAM
jgi:hypothetical protein